MHASFTLSSDIGMHAHLFLLLLQICMAPQGLSFDEAELNH